ncbi:hypothetical protein PR048_025158 [Dryococelus australis]|uniref:Uncharacterized protein n=1 Tax=Dryococelus australis TaxID=614101 RepID=A0ABQ9GQM2_9NEOP|nr:hypothetical protein PR048_025158 [Dryococelus australis]
MENLKPPGELNVSREVGMNWKQWRRKFKIYMKTSDAVKVATLLNVIGEKALHVYETWELTPDEENDCKVVLQKFKDF